MRLGAKGNKGDTQQDIGHCMLPLVSQSVNSYYGICKDIKYKMHIQENIHVLSMYIVALWLIPISSLG